MWRWVLCVLLALPLGGCASSAYYGQAIHGQAALLWRRQPITKLLADPATPGPLARRLAKAQAARRFASSDLDLPRNRSYTYYVDLHRRYVVWNVFATPRYAVDPLLQCFPIAGCVAYRGYFHAAAAQRQARRLRAAGEDVEIDGVAAYSTLGWFADPILSSMLAWDDDTLAATIFHELAHQRIYVAGDTAFNESFASFVEREGLRAWRHAQGLPPRNRRAELFDAAFSCRVLQFREQLRRRYAAAMRDRQALRQAKRQAFAAFRLDYRHWRDAHWPGQHAYDGWVQGPLNNASLLPFGLYDRWQGAFAAMFRQMGGQWPAFYRVVRELAQMPARRRLDYLQRWAAAGRADQPPRCPLGQLTAVQVTGA